MQPTDLRDVIDTSMRSLRSRLKSPSDSRGIQVVCEYGELSTIECSPEISQVFTSLIAQAVEVLSTHIDSIKRPLISIRTMQIPDPQGGNPRVVVCVADNGAEIPFDMQSQIFSSSHSAPRASSALSACYDIVVNQHGGDLQCYSQSGSTEFWVELPVRRLQRDASSCWVLA